jgi:hypothetical protein
MKTIEILKIAYRAAETYWRDSVSQQEMMKEIYLL